MEPLDGTDDTVQLTHEDRRVPFASHALDGNDPGCISEARRHAAAFLGEDRTAHRPPITQRVRDLTALVVSELVTNAHKYAPGPVRMELWIHAGSVEVSVCDSRSAVPAVRGVDPGRIGQHGMEIIQALADHLSIEPRPDGKRITVRLSLTGAPDPA
ncbi:ATP-binding protein [Streptomyces sp. NPDC096351]|uniref:ATP-binding protein n=1 Tax=Streptomyces sp. NPDC096351 TaxID=3366087 RepID=UPI00382A0CDD